MEQVKRRELTAEERECLERNVDENILAPMYRKYSFNQIVRTLNYAMNEAYEADQPMTLKDFCDNVMDYLLSPKAMRE